MTLLVSLPLMYTFQELWAEAHIRGLSETEKECASLIVAFEGESGSGIQVELNPLHLTLRNLLQNDSTSTVLKISRKYAHCDKVCQYFYFAAQLKNGVSSVAFEELQSTMAPDDIFLKFLAAQYFLQSDLLKSAETTLLEIVSIQPAFMEAWDLLLSCVADAETLKFICTELEARPSILSVKILASINAKYCNSLTKQSLKVCLKCIDNLSSTIIESHYFKCISFMYQCSENDLKGAEELADDCATEYPAIYSDLLYIQGKKETLKQLSKKCIDLFGWCSETCYVLGNTYSLIRNHNSAQVWFNRAVTISPKFENALLLEGNEFIELKQPSHAIKCFDQVLKLNPLNYRAYFSLGNIYYLLDDLDKAVFYLKQALKIEENDFRVYDLLADCYGLLGLPEHATEQLSTAVGLPKAPTNLYKKLGLLYQSLGNTKQYVSSFAQYFTRQIDSGSSSSLEIADESEFEAASNIIKEPSSMQSNYLKILSSAVFKYPSKKKNSFLAPAEFNGLVQSKFVSENIAFDYTDLQMTVRSVTAAGSSKAEPKQLQYIVQETFQSAKKCHEILACISERLKSKRSSSSSVTKALELMEDLLGLGSEAFLTQAVDLKPTLIEVCNTNVNTSIKSKAAHLVKLLSERDRLFELRQRKAAGECSIDIVYAQNSEINRSTESFPIYYNQ